MRDRQRVEVPALVGLNAAAARDAALDAGLLAVLQHHAPADPSAVAVNAQHPPPGRRLRRGARVQIWATRDDGPDDGHGRGGDPSPVGPLPKVPAGTKPMS